MSGVATGPQSSPPKGGVGFSNLRSESGRNATGPEVGPGPFLNGVGFSRRPVVLEKLKVVSQGDGGVVIKAKLAPAGTGLGLEAGAHFSTGLGIEGACSESNAGATSNNTHTCLGKPNK